MKKSTKYIPYSSPSIGYSESFKRQVVSEIERGFLTKEGARRKYHIGGKTTVLNWCRKYGDLDKINAKVKVMSHSESDKLDNQSSEIASLKEKLAILEDALKYSELKSRSLETLIEVAGQNLGQDLKKNFGTKASAASRKKKP